MFETLPTPESPRTSRQEVVDAYRKFTEAGITNPDVLDLANPEVIKANALYFKWIEECEKDDPDHGEVSRRQELDQTMINIDAGFTDELYLEEVLGWLMQDAQNAEKIKDDTERTKTRDMIAAAIKKVRDLLEGAKPKD